MFAGSEWQDDDARRFGLAAPRAASGGRRTWVAVQPLDETGLECLYFGRNAQQATVMLQKPRAFVEVCSPVLSGPTRLSWPQQSENAELMTREHIQHGLRWLGARLKHEVFAIKHHRDASRMGGAKGLGRAHNRLLQAAPLRSPRPDRLVIFASAPSAAVASLFFNELARTVGLSTRPPPSASRATVRRGGAPKPFPELVFGEDADGADGADGCVPGFSGVAEGWIVVILMVRVRVRARPSRPKPTSMPILRRNVAARRSRPASARGPSGQVLDLATRSPATSARAPRRSEAVPVHTVRVA